MHLAMRHILLKLEIFQGTVVCEDLEVYPQETRGPFLEGLNDGEQFLFVNWIVLFRTIQLI